MADIPRLSEFESNMVSSDVSVSGAPIWAYGHIDHAWEGWDEWIGAGVTLMEGQYYYDAGRTFYEIATYTGDSQWETPASQAVINCYLNYVENGNAAQYAETPPRTDMQAKNLFPYGLYFEWQRTSEPTLKARLLKAIDALANCSNFGVSYPIISDPEDPNYQSEAGGDWTPDLYHAREIGYNLTAKYKALETGYASRYGGDPWGLTDSGLVGLAFRYVDQAIELLQGNDTVVVNPDHRYVRPFMMGNLCDGLIAHYNATGDIRVPTKIETLLGHLWDVCFLPNGITMPDFLPDGTTPAPYPGYVWGPNSMHYTDRLGTGMDTGPNGLGATTDDPTVWTWNGSQWHLARLGAYAPTPDLNGLILPYYYWLFKHTGNTLWRDRGDLLFDGLVQSCNKFSMIGQDAGAQYDNDGKVFNQIYSKTFTGLEFRAEGEAALQAMPTINQSHPLATGLTRCYNFEASDGELIDIVTGDPIGALIGSGAPTIEDLAPYGKSLLFPGTSGYTIPEIDTVTPPATYTIYAVFKTDPSASSLSVVSTGQSGNWSGARIRRIGEQAYFYHNDGGEKIINPTPTYAGNTVYHAAMTYDGTNLVGYVDGASVGSLAANAISVPFGDKCAIGCDGFFGDNFWDENIWAVYIWYNRALTSTEISDLFADHDAFITLPGVSLGGRRRKRLLRRIRRRR